MRSIPVPGAARRRKSPRTARHHPEQPIASAAVRLRALIAILICAASGAFASATIASVPQHLLIVPGVSVGSVRVGDTQSAVRTALGKPSVIRTKGKVTNWTWFKRRVVVLFASTGKRRGHAIVISTSNPAYGTAAGIEPLSSTKADVTAAYPAAVCDDSAGVCRLAGPAGRLTTFTYATDKVGELSVSAISVAYAHP